MDVLRRLFRTNKVNRIYEEDDQIVVDTKIQRNKVVENYKDGKIYVCIKNV